MAQTSISWTEQTWNPLAGCSIVSTECRECYAMKLAHRLAAMGQEKYKGLTEVRNGHVVWNGTVRLDTEALKIPLKRKKPTLYFVNSMSDMFHEEVSPMWAWMIFDVMGKCPQHTFQVLTKRPERMLDMLANNSLFCRYFDPDKRAFVPRILPNVWWGVSVGNKDAKKRIDYLRQTPAAVRFLSCEPLLEDLGELNLEGIQWVIVGGESGPNARPCNLEWIRSIVSQCYRARVACYVKQLGSKPFLHKQQSVDISKPGLKFKMQSLEINSRFKLSDPKGGDPSEWPKDLQVRQYPRVEAREVANA